LKIRISNENFTNSLLKQTSAVQVSDVSFVDAKGTASREVAISLACSESVACMGIVLAMSASNKCLALINRAHTA